MLQHSKCCIPPPQGYIGVDNDSTPDLGEDRTDFYTTNPKDIVAGTTNGWFINLGGANRLDSLTLNFVGDAAHNTTTISITKPEGSGAITEPRVLNVDTLIDPSLIQVNTGRIGTVQIAYTPEPATATLSLLALAGLAARRKRH